MRGEKAWLAVGALVNPTSVGWASQVLPLRT